MVGMKRHTNGLTCSGHDPGGAAVVQQQGSSPTVPAAGLRSAAAAPGDRCAARFCQARATAHGISTWRTNRGSGAWRRATGRPGRRTARGSPSMPRPARASSVMHADGTGVPLLWDPAATPTGRPTGARLVFDGEGGAGNFCDERRRLRCRQTDRPRARENAQRRRVWPSSWPAWSPDGQRIAFVCAAYEEVWQIHIVNADGSNPHPLIAGSD